MTLQQIKTTYTKEVIQHKLTTDYKWLERGLVLLFSNQTNDEKVSSETKWENGVGFNSSDSRYLSYCSKWVLKGNQLSGVHIEKCRKKIVKYWKQIQEEIIRKNVG